MKSNFMGIHGNSWEFMGIIFFLVVFGTPNEVEACEWWQVHVNGPSLVCPSTTYEFSTDIPPEFLCGSFKLEEWNLQEGLAIFVDGNGNSLGNKIICEEYANNPNAPCIPHGIVRIRTYSQYGSFGYSVYGHCSGIATAFRQYTVNIGLPPPASVSGPPTPGCIGSNLLYSATEVPNAASYTWSVPNSTWRVNDVNGPFVTLTGSLISPGPPTPTITVGSNLGNSQVGVRANTAECAGNGFTYTPVSVYTSAPGFVGISISSSGCTYETVSITASASNAIYYFLQVTENGSSVWTTSGPTPNFNFTPAHAGSYQVFMTASNACGTGPSGQASFETTDCGSCTVCPRIAQDDKPTADPITTFAKIALYPNPANTEFNVRLRAPAEQEGELALIDISGNIKSQGIIENGRQLITVNTCDLFPGIYFVKIFDGTKEYYRKVLIQH